MRGKVKLKWPIRKQFNKKICKICRVTTEVDIQIWNNPLKHFFGSYVLNPMSQGQTVNFFNIQKKTKLKTKLTTPYDYITVLML